MSTNSPQPSDERYAFIQALRGIAAMLVVWSHLGGFWLLENQEDSPFQRAWSAVVVQPLHLYQNGGHLGVVTFFLISGFIITHASLRESRKTFFIRRVLRLGPPLLVATAIAAVLLVVAQATNTVLLGVRGGGVGHWLASTILVDGFLPGDRALDVTWTLVVEVAFYALTFAALRTTRLNPLRASWVLIGVWLALCLVMFALPDGALGKNHWVLFYVGFLLVGRAIYFWSRGIIRPLDAALQGALVLLLYCLFTEAVVPGFLLKPGGWGGVEPVVSYAIALLAFILLLRAAPRRAVQPFEFFGNISYSLYLLHLPVGITVLNAFQRMGVATWIGELVALLASVVVSWVSYRWIEKPSQRLARRLTRPATLAE